MKRIWIGALMGMAFVLGSLAGCGRSAQPSTDGAGEKPQIVNADLKVGDRAPDFRLPDHQGGYVRLSDFLGESNVVLAFYPAAFTPV